MNALATLPAAISIRTVIEQDMDALVSMNNQAIPAVSKLTRTALEDLISLSIVCLVAEREGEPCGFLLCLADGVCSYRSHNYAWLSNKLPRFAYVDRIVVGEQARGQKIGEAFYRTLFQNHTVKDRPFVCEVNSHPPNPGSMRFHQRLGFGEIGAMDHGDKAVVFLQRRPNATVSEI